MSGYDHFVQLWNSIIRENELEVQDNVWRLNGDESWGNDNVMNLLIREDWIKLGDVILSLPNAPHCVLLRENSGRGKTAFMKYLIFRILFEAKSREKLHCSVDSSLLTYAKDEHLYAPQILYVNSSKHCYHVTLNEVSVWPFGSSSSSIHYYFSDSIDIKYGTFKGSRVTLAMTNGEDSLNDFEKHVYREPKSVVLNMPSWSLVEMTKLFQKINNSYTDQEIFFKYGIIGGNLRFFRCTSSADHSTETFRRVSKLVERLFPNESPTNKSWAVNVVSNGVEGISRNMGRYDGLFKDYIVSDGHFNNNRDREVHFVSTFMGLIALDMQNHTYLDERAKKLLLSYQSKSILFKYQALLALIGTTTINDENAVQFCCFCPLTNEFVTFRLGGGNVKIVNDITDCKNLVAGDYALPMIRNSFQSVVDALQVLQKPFGSIKVVGFRMVTTASDIDLPQQFNKHNDSDGSNNSDSDSGDDLAQLTHMLSVLNIHQQEFALVYVLPRDNIAGFQVPKSGLDHIKGDKIKVFMTISEPSTESVMRELLGMQKSAIKRLVEWLF